MDLFSATSQFQLLAMESSCSVCSPIQTWEGILKHSFNCTYAPTLDTASVANLPLCLVIFFYKCSLMFVAFYGRIRLLPENKLPGKTHTRESLHLLGSFCKAHSAGHIQNTLLFFVSIPTKSDDRQSFGKKCDTIFAYNRGAD